MLNDPRQEPFRVEGNPLAPATLALHHHTRSPGNLGDDTRNRETRLRAKLFAFPLSDTRINHDVKLLFDLGHKNAFAHAHLRRGQPEPAGLVHGGNHLVDQSLDLACHPPYRFRTTAQETGLGPVNGDNLHVPQSTVGLQDCKDSPSEQVDRIYINGHANPSWERRFRQQVAQAAPDGGILALLDQYLPPELASNPRARSRRGAQDVPVLL